MSVALVASELQRCYSVLGALTTWRRRAAAFILGACAVLALPPFFLVPFLVPAFTGLLLLLESASSQKWAFWDGWWWGYGFYLAGLYWVCISMLTDVARYGWMIPFALLGLPAVIAIFPALTCACARRCFVDGEIFKNLMRFCVIFGIVEFLRGHVLTGFPWNLAGYAWMATDASAQAASVLGIYGLTLLTVMFAAAPALLMWRRGALMLGVIWFPAVLMVAGGAYRLQTAGETNFIPDVRLRLVQPNIAQHHKWDPSRQQEMLEHQIRLSLTPKEARPTHIIWPETAVPYLLAPDTQLAFLLGKVAPPGGALVIGGLRAENTGSPDWKVWNSLAVLDSNGAFISAYDKHHLVPFGEYMPLRFLLPVSAEHLIAGIKDFSDGSGPALLSVPGLPEASPLICYEAIFPETAVPVGGKRAGWLLNITNDAWFGRSTGPQQHFHMSRMRAIEQGLPLVRVANTGISAVTDSYGRITALLGLGEEGVLDAALPDTAPPTWYGRCGNTLFWLLAAFMLAATYVSSRFCNKRNP